ncbi:ubiquitin-like domain-containing protein, partial [Haematococcus lacustris]
MPPKGTKDRLAKDAGDLAALLERCAKRLEWEKVRERELKDAADEAERERLAYQAIDWHEFVVVDTIEFFDDEDEELPPPLTIKDIIAMTKAQVFGQQEEGTETAPADTPAVPAAAVAMTQEEKEMVSPITGELIAVADMAEHMRVSLIDPRWKEQREAMLSKIRDHTRASDEEIGRNLVGLAKTRPDIF